MDDWHIFAWGVFGSLAADLMRLRKASDRARAGLPALYRQPRFYLVALATAVVAGGVAIAEGADKPLLAFEVGVAAPLIVQNLGRKPPSLSP